MKLIVLVYSAVTRPAGIQCRSQTSWYTVQ